MKKILFTAIMLTLCVGVVLAQTSATPPAQRGAAARGAAPAATGPIADIANAQIEAINKGDAAFFDTHLAADVVWFDEDGHAIAGKDRVNGFIKMRLMTPGKKVSITGLRVGSSGDMGWAGYQYTVDGGPAQRKGTQTVVYKKVVNDWQIVMVHGAANAASHG